MRGNQVAQGIGPVAALAGKLRLLVLPLFIVTFLTLSVAPALGAKVHALKGTFGSFTIPSSVAIDETNGNVFVADASYEAADAGVDIFGAAGGAPSGVSVTHVAAPPADPGDGLNERLAIAVDNSLTSPSKGALYLKDAGNHAVAKLTLNPLSEEYEPAGMLSATPTLSEALGVAVDAKGNVFVGAYQLSAIIEFSPTGTEIGRIAFPAGEVNALAFDSAGDLFASSGSSVWRFTANGAGEIELNATPTQIRDSSSTGIAIDRSTDTLYVASGTRVAQYSTACTPVKGKCEPELEFGFGILGSTRGIAVNSASGDIYVTDRANHDVAVFDPAVVAVPDPVTKDTSQVTETSATLDGTISAAGGPNASCEFQYTSKEDFDAEEFEGASTAPCSPAGPFTGVGEEAVNAAISGLSSEATYVFRLIATNENGSNFGEALSFGTVGLPKILASSITEVGADSATVKGLIDPNGGPGTAVAPTYWVEYVSAADFEASGYANATKVPPDGEALGSGIESVEVAQQLSGLSLLSAYHFRIVAENEAGEEIGPDRVFSTLSEATPGLPDGRVYEQVTPVDKNGAAPAGRMGQVQAASDGNGIVYLSGGGIPGSEGAQQFPTHLSSRASDWSTQGLLPPASAGASASVFGWDEDLAQAYVAQSEVPSGPEATFFQRDSATHSLRPIATRVEGGDLSSFTFVDAATDGSVVVFESGVPLSPGGAAKGFNTYVWDRGSGELQLAGIFNKGQVPAKGTLAGSNEPLNHKHYTQAQNTVSNDGSRIFFTDAGTGQLYVRLNPIQPQSELDGTGNCTEPTMACTVQISASQRAVPDPKGTKPAAFMTATPDGSKVFFTSAGKLTDDATTGPGNEGNDLYRYDVEGRELLDITPDTEPGDPNGADVRGVIGASDDGSYVYFVANGVLAAGAAPGECSGVGASSLGGTCSLYLWHDGTIVFIVKLQLNNGSTPSDGANWNSSAFGEKTARVTPDGQTLLFRSARQFTAYDSQGFAEFYRYSATSGNLICVTCNPTGAAPIETPTLRSIDKYITSSSSAATLTRNLSADGKRVFFETADKLVASDTNGIASCKEQREGQGGVHYCQDVYEWEAKGTGTCESEAQNGGCLYLLSTGTSTEPAYFGDASVNGDDAFIYTDQPLVGQDKDQITDIYDARVGGGIASQNPPPPPPICEGEACKGVVPPAPANQSPGSASFSGPGNPKPSRHKKKSHHKKKKHHKRHATQKNG